MARTELLKPYVSRIDSLNDQLWYFLFISEELNQQLLRYSPKAQELFTVDLFSNNPFSQRIHVRGNELINHQNQNKKLTFGAYFSTCYEIASNYVKDIFIKLKAINALPNYDWDRRISPEENLINLLNANGIQLPNANCLNTFTYLRLRRNHFTHIIDTANGRLVGFCGNFGTALNAHWVATGTVLNIDFRSTANVNEFNREITIELIKILRISLIELDSYIASILDVNAVIKLLVEREYGHKTQNINALITAKRISRIIAVANTELALVLTEAQCKPYVTTIGVR